MKKESKIKFERKMSMWAIGSLILVIIIFAVKSAIESGRPFLP